MTGTKARRRGRPRNRYYDGPPSDHFDGAIFFNPHGAPPRRLIDLLRWQLGGNRAPWPRHWPSPHPSARPVERVSGPAMRLTMVGHATLLIQAAGFNLLTDPVWSERVSPFSFAGPRRVNAPGIALDALPPIDAVLVSHNHYDHLDLATLKALHERHDPLVITPLGNDSIIRHAAPRMRVAVHDWGESVPLGTAGAVVHLEPAHHWSARGTRDQRMALWAGFVVESEAGNVLFAGDTGFHDGRNYRLLAEKHGGFRLAILPIGAYSPRWFMQAQHQNPEEAVEAMLIANAAYAAGCHWGTFHLTNEPIDEPRQRLGAALAARGIAADRFQAMRPGDVWEVPQGVSGRSSATAADRFPLAEPELPR